MYLIFDTETTGFPKNFDAPHTDLDNWPRLVQIAWQLHSSQGNLISTGNLIVKPEGFTIPYNAEKVHGISTEIAIAEGKPLADVLQRFAEDVAKAEVVIGHNIQFDLNVTGAEFIRADVESRMWDKIPYDTKSDETANFVQIPGGRGGKFKWPTLTELHEKLFGEAFDAAHDAAYDVAATARIFFGLIAQGIAPLPDGLKLEDIKYEFPVLDEANFVKKQERKGIKIPPEFQGELDKFIPFCHLHAHSQFSILQSTSDVKKLVTHAKELGMPAIAVTDHGNMHAAFNAVAQGANLEIKVIMGCEVYMTQDRSKKKFTKNDPDRRYHQVLLATDQAAYHRLARLCSLGYTEGYYSGYPRVDKEIIAEHAEGLIALTGSIWGEIPALILNVGEHEAEEAFQWWHQTFGDNFYVELQRHGLEEEERVNEVLLRFAAKYGVKPIAAHSNYYLTKKDADAHDTLLCVRDGEKKSINKIFQPDVRRRGYRYGFPNEEFYFKTAEEMNQAFSDIPVALENVQEIVDKCSPIKIKRDILMPKYEIPDEFEDQDDFLRHLTYEGAKTRYPEMTNEIRERLDHELKIIKNMGFPGYFLIVQDFINAAKDMGVFVGPGRGSAAGSAVAFCIGITNIDPIKYSLLFERFLNPERVSMPDIDIDFDDDGRQDAINYVIDKYGKNQVAQIITYGTMAAKMAIKDVARAQDLPLDQSNYLAKLVPEKPGTKLQAAISEVAELRQISQGRDERAKVLEEALILEGSVRNTGIHAAGVIIAPDDLLKYIPVSTSKDSDLMVTQFDGKVVEDAGMLKMDFLGLKTLTIIKDALKLIKKNHQKDIDIDAIPLDDEKTFALYQRGETIGTFQFESPGMQKYLRELKPTNIEDLIAMNALYRPGPMDFIPNFINRKHGREAIDYPHPLLEPILSNSNGIMVYQEQIMQTAQILGGYTLGGADLLRRAMGKKKIAEMERQEVIFIDGAKEKHDIPEAKAREIFEVMKKFAAYGFNRSHSAAYSVVAYQTGYLKANYMPEYMAAVLTHNMNSIEKITFFIEEAQRQNVAVLGPDLNESLATFGVNEQGQIRFGLAAIKGTGDAAISHIIEERENNGTFADIFDFARRIDLRTVNKKSFECLVMAGAFDSFGLDRSLYFSAAAIGDNYNFIEKIIRYGQAYKKDQENNTNSLFGNDVAAEIATPDLPKTTPIWSKLEKLNKEKEVVGFFISGHPLDEYRNALRRFKVKALSNLAAYDRQEIQVAGIVTQKSVRQSRNGNEFTSFSIEDLRSSLELVLFSQAHEEFSEQITVESLVLITGKVQKSFRDENRYELRISKIEDLSQYKETRCQGVEARLELQQLNEALLQNIEDLLKQNTGEQTFRLTVWDYSEGKLEVEMTSQYKVEVSDNFISKIEMLNLGCQRLY